VSFTADVDTVSMLGVEAPFKSSEVQMTVGELALQAGVRPSTVRYYERLGLLPKAPRSSGRRTFDANALAHFAVVQLARDCGFTLREIGQLVKGSSRPTPMSERWNAVVPDKIAEMDAAIARAQAMKRLLVRITGCQCATLAQCGRRILNSRPNRDGAPRY
jgi:MerR family transcriptional regulator, redox-sensitive transcriptional activator SoxR